MIFFFIFVIIVWLNLAFYTLFLSAKKVVFLTTMIKAALQESKTTPLFIPWTLSVMDISSTSVTFTWLHFILFSHSKWSVGTIFSQIEVKFHIPTQKCLYFHLNHLKHVFVPLCDKNVAQHLENSLNWPKTTFFSQNRHLQPQMSPHIQNSTIPVSYCQNSFH